MPWQDRLPAGRRCWRHVFVAALACAVVHGQATAALAQDPQHEARTALLRAMVLLKIAPYITPEGQAATKNKQYRIGVVGTDAVATAVQQELPGKKVEHACVTVTAVEPKAAATGAGAGDLDLLWIAASVDDATLQRIIAAYADKPVVLICERASFAAQGGGVQLFVRDNCMRFQVNADALKKQGLRPSAQVLKLSRKGPCQ